ncbi:mediator complex subunit [Elasticomyces elasticus]|nr:mediator complex subunit [Elasticomyces elasticus]
MDQQSGLGSQELKKNRSNAQGALVGAVMPPSSNSVPAHLNGVPANGENIVVVNGQPLKAVAATTNGDHADAIMALAEPEQPPNLEQPWRNEPDNKPLGKLMDRLAQQCYIDLNQTLNDMTAEDAAGDGLSKANGMSPQGTLDTSEVSLQKKRKLLDFAHDQRDRFTKTLVLSDWSRNAEDMAKFIDLRIHLDNQRDGFVKAGNAIAATKWKSIGFKVPAPNIVGAMELLSTGTASWVPDMGYIPPKRLTAKQLLKTLKNMNVTLSTRLNLHEELPPHMQDYRVADGRATFTVPGEFEVDLSVADEEDTSPFYFIDIRFLFSPSSDVLNDQIRAHLETQTNGALAVKGLKGCYDFLHSFVLTHKINILRSQGAELIRGKWFECIKVEHLRRSLVVQYWAGMPGPKSWFEIGISSGKSEKRGMRKATSRLSVRWFRKGQEVKDEVLSFDWEKLSLEKCLMMVIGKHCFGKLGVARDGLLGLAAKTENAALEAELVVADGAAPEDCTLRLRLPSMRNSLIVRLEPVTGQFSISPPTNATLHNERILNANPQVDVSLLLAALVCAVVQEKVHKQAELLDWCELRDWAGMEQKLGQHVLHRTVFGIPGWGERWALAVGFSLSGERWWIVQLKEGTKDVTNVCELQLKKSLGEQATQVSRVNLLSIERFAVAEVSYEVFSEQLRALKIPHHHQKPEPLSEDGVDAGQHNSGSIYVQFAALLRDRSDISWKPWATDSIRLSHHGIDDCEDGTDAHTTRTLVRHDLRLTREPGRMNRLQQHLTKSGDRTVAMNASGALALSLRTPFGEPLVGHIRTRLRSIERLDQYVTTLQRHHYNLTTVTMNQLSFTYHASAPSLHARLSFANDGSTPIRLQLEPAASNPTQRIRVLLEQGLNSRRADAFEGFAKFLRLTLPMLRAWDRIETAHLARQTAVVNVRGAASYGITYKAPLPPCTFSIQLKEKRNGNKPSMRWHLEVKGKPDPVIAEDLAKKLKALWQSKGDGGCWEGNGSGATADAAGLGSLLDRLDEIVRTSNASRPVSEQPREVTAAPRETVIKQQQPPALKEPQKKPAVRPVKAPVKVLAHTKEPEYITLD